MVQARVSIAGLMALVALCAVEVASLRIASLAWLDACRVLTVAVLVVATFLARGRAGGEGAFWFGFAVLGWATYLLVLDVLGDPQGSHLSHPLYPLLMALEPDHNDLANYHRVMRLGRILHLQMILPAAILGGCVGWLLDRRKRRHPCASPAPDSGSACGRS